MVVACQRHAPCHFPAGKDLVPIVQEARWAPGLVWTSAESLTPPWAYNPWTTQPVASCYTV